MGVSGWRLREEETLTGRERDSSAKMDAIRKKMQSLKGETDQLYTIIRNFEEEAKEAVARANQARDYNFAMNSFFRPIVTFVTMERKFSNLRLDLMKLMTS